MLPYRKNEKQRLNPRAYIYRERAHTRESKP
jgi:hypothetical protein